MDQFQILKKILFQYSPYCPIGYNGDWPDFPKLRHTDNTFFTSNFIAYIATPEHKECLTKVIRFQNNDLIFGQFSKSLDLMYEKWQDFSKLLYIEPGCKFFFKNWPKCFKMHLIYKHTIK